MALKKDFKFRLLVDDAHGFGTMGEGGRGTASHFGVVDGVDVLFNTFAKSMAGIGAFVSGPRWLINLLRYNMRSQLYAKSLPMPMVIGALKRLELIRNHPEYQQKLWTIVRALQSGLKENGFNIGVTNNPARTSTTFIISHDRMESNMDVVIELFDAAGRQMWRHADVEELRTQTFHHVEVKHGCRAVVLNVPCAELQSVRSFLQLGNTIKGGATGIGSEIVAEVVVERISLRHVAIDDELKVVTYSAAGCIDAVLILDLCHKIRRAVHISTINKRGE